MDSDNAKKAGGDLNNPMPAFGAIIAAGLIIWGAIVFFGSSPGNTGAVVNDTASSTITTLYTNTTVNVRACASTSCKLVGTYPPNTSVDITATTNGTVTDVSQLPDWVAFAYSATDGSSATGYISKTVLSDKLTQAPTSDSATPTVTPVTPTFTDASGNLSSSAIAQIEPSVVEINCYSYDNSMESSGSGLSYTLKGDDNNYIVTNYHVYTGAVVGGQTPLCYAVFPAPPNFYYNESYGDYSLVLTAWHYNPSTYEDAAVFSLGSPLPKTPALDHIPVISEALKNLGVSTQTCSDADAKVGDSVTIFGYPKSGNLLGISETVTQGIISGILPGPIYKTNAAIDHGNSGGLAVLNKKACKLGIPTLGESGLTSGIGYIQSATLIDTPVN